MDVDGELTGGGCECMWWVVNEVVVADTRWLHTVIRGGCILVSY